MSSRTRRPYKKPSYKGLAYNKGGQVIITLERLIYTRAYRSGVILYYMRTHIRVCIYDIYIYMYQVHDRYNHVDTHTLYAYACVCIYIYMYMTGTFVSTSKLARTASTWRLAESFLPTLACANAPNLR